MSFAKLWQRLRRGSRTINQARRPESQQKLVTPRCSFVPRLDLLEDRTLLSAVSFGAPVNCAVGPSPVAVALGDFNGDGKPDLAVANNVSVSVLLGNGDGT